MSSGQVLVYENPEENWLAEITCERKNLKSRVQSKEIIKVLRKKSAAADSNKSHTWQEALQQHFKFTTTCTKFIWILLTKIIKVSSFSTGVI